MAGFVSRSSWGARAPRSRPTNITPGNGGVTIHHMDEVRTARSYHSDCASQVRGIQNHHMDINGWGDIAYTYLVCIHGYVFDGRGPGVRTAANGTTSGNQNWYAVCALTGGTRSNYDPITYDLLDALRWSIADLRGYGGAGRGINRHSDHMATSCPGNLSSWVLDGSLDPDYGMLSWPGVVFSHPPSTEHPGVGVWQRRMRDRGWDIEVDGQYGELSRGVCERFQAEQDLPVDGAVGPKTWEATFS